jgi:hypothetical protein
LRSNREIFAINEQHPFFVNEIHQSDVLQGILGVDSVRAHSTPHAFCEKELKLGQLGPLKTTSNPKGYWADPAPDIRRMGDEDGEQEVIVTAWEACDCCSLLLNHLLA